MGGFNMGFTGLILQYLPWAVGGVLLVATSFFLRQFFSPSRRLHNELDAAIREVGEIKQRLGCVPMVDLDEIQAVMVTDGGRRSWRVL